jgi:glyceraldehyde-3-phosphate dehydrogenase/erythrose-4-phosphate dehydrogenase
MPTVEVNVETSVDVDVNIIDILEECSKSEIEDILGYLEENEFISGKQKIDLNATYDEVEFNKVVNKLSRLYLQIDQEDWKTIQKLIEKY